MDLRGAAERLERGIEKYGAGDLEGALNEFEEALKLYPASARGQAYAGWVRDVKTGKRALPAEPRELATQEALRVAAEALDDHAAPRPTAGQAGAPPTAALAPTGPAPAPTGGLGTAPTMQAVDAPPPPERERRLTPSPPPTGETTRPRRPSVPPPSLSAQPPPSEESPWDPVPLTPTGHEHPGRAQPAAQASSSTILGMPPLEPRLLAPQRERVLSEERPESVTREFRSSTPTGPNLRPLDVPELTEEQIQGLLSLDALPESPTTPQIELDRIDGFVDPGVEHLLELEAVPTPLPTPAPAHLRNNDTSPMGMESLGGEEFEPHQLTPTGVKATPPRPVRVAGPEDDPYADLHLLSLDAEEPEEGGTHPTNPFIRGPKLAEYAGVGGDDKLEELPPLPTLPGARAPASPLATAEAALAAGNAALAVDECEAALAAAGGPTGELARLQQPLLEQIYAAILRGPHRIPVHGAATANLDPRSAFLLSRVDGAMTVEDVLDVSGMPRPEALRVMALLVRRGALVVK